MPASDLITASNANPNADFFRCPIQQEASQASIHVGRRKVKAMVQDTSIDGFTVLVSNQEAKKLKVGESWILDHDETRFEVHAQWFFNDPQGGVQIGLRRMRDLTPMPVIRQPIRQRFFNRNPMTSTSAAGYGGFVLIIFLAMALPGLGDQLGTSDRIQTAAQWLYQEFNAAFGIG